MFFNCLYKEPLILGKVEANCSSYSMKEHSSSSDKELLLLDLLLCEFESGGELVLFARSITFEAGWKT